jgi:hypothetical protein
VVGESGLGGGVVGRGVIPEGALRGGRVVVGTLGSSVVTANHRLV